MATCPFEEGLAEINQGFKVIRGSYDASNPSDSLEFSENVELSAAVARDFRCKVCGGMVVDLATAQIYCGLNAPVEVLESNQRILAS